MGKRIVFLVDVDEVLGDFQTPTFEVMLRVTGRSYRSEDFDTWNIFDVLDDAEMKAVAVALEAPGFCFGICPTPGAIQAIETIREWADVYAVTSPQHNRHWVYERTEWLYHHFHMPKVQIIHTAAKHMIRGDVFLDDKPEHVRDWSLANPTGDALLWHIPNTRSIAQHLRRVKTWDEVIQRVCLRASQVQHQT